MMSLIIISQLLLVGFVIAAGYWMWLVKGLKHKRYRAFLRLVPVLDERIKIVEQLVGLVGQNIKSEKALCAKITSLGNKGKEERNKIKQRLSIEVKLTYTIFSLVKVIQQYNSLRAHPKIMQAQIALAEIEERIASDMLLFNTLTERYNKEVELRAMKPFASLLKLRRHREYYVVREE